MARVFIATSLPLVKVIYTVDQSVGPGCSNEKRDVMVVQFFLRAASKSGGGLPAIQPPGQTPLTVDGAIHEKTLTIVHLNVGYAKRFGAERHSRIDQDSDFPAALRSALFV